MASEWREVTVPEIAARRENALSTGPFGSSISSRFFQDFGIPVIRGSNLTDTVGERLVETGLVFVSPEKATEFTRSIARRGDLVFTCWGTIGQVGIIDDRAEFNEYVVSNKQMKLTPNPEVADSLFLYYAFSGPALSFQIKNQAIGSSVPGFNLGQLKGIRLLLPHLAEQRAIAGVLGALDDKIAQNRQTAQALERLARATFRAWFVDFEPVKAKAAGATSFPSMPQPVFDALPTRLMDSKIGPLPEGWQVGTISDVAEQSKTQVKPQEHGEEVFEHLSIPAFDAGRNPVVESGAAIKSNKFLVIDGCVLLSKLNPRIPRVWLPPKSGERRQIASTEFLVLMPRAGFDHHYLYCLFQQSQFREDLAQGASGTSNSHQRVRPIDLLSKRVAIPPATCCAGFQRIAKPLFSLSASNHAESGELGNLRDYLLPKLLTGQVSVSDAESAAEALP